MDHATFHHEEDFNGLNDPLDQTVSYTQNGVSEFGQAVEAQVAWVDHFVQMTDGLVVIDDNNVSGILATRVHQQAEAEVAVVLLLQLCFRHLQCHLIDGSELLADNGKQVTFNFFWRHSTFAGLQQVEGPGDFFVIEVFSAWYAGACYLD
jgi:hypothetical protein